MAHEASYNAQTAIDDAAHIIVAAELTNCASDAGELPTMLRAVRDNLGRLPKQVLADTGYKSEAVFEAWAGTGCDLVVALGREGKRVLNFDPERSPRTAAMAAWRWAAGMAGRVSTGRPSCASCASSPPPGNT